MCSCLLVILILSRNVLSLIMNALMYFFIVPDIYVLITVFFSLFSLLVGYSLCLIHSSKQFRKELKIILNRNKEKLKRKMIKLKTFSGWFELYDLLLRGSFFSCQLLVMFNDKMRRITQEWIWKLQDGLFLRHWPNKFSSN